MNRLNIDRVADRLAARVPQVAAQVVDYKLVTPTLARVIVTSHQLNADPRELCAAVSRALDMNARPIEGSWREIEAHWDPAAIGYVALNKEVRTRIIQT